MENATQNIVVVGDGEVGKTSLLFAYKNESMITNYTPTIFAKTEIELTLDGRTYPINFHDTSGHEEFEKVRQVFYKTADAIVLCYSTVDRNSFENVEYKWCRELQHPIRRHVPIILVGTKLDLRKSTSPVVTTGEGIQLCNRLNAKAFLECSACTQTNIAEVIYESVRAAVRFSADPTGDQTDEADGRHKSEKETSRPKRRLKRNSFRILFHKCF